MSTEGCRRFRYGCVLMMQHVCCSAPHRLSRRDAARLQRRRDRARRAAAARSSGSSPCCCAAIALSFAVERVIPYKGEWNHDHGDSRRDVAHALVNEVEALAAIAALPVLAELVRSSDAWPDGWPFAIQVLAAILVFDLGITLVHFASHHVGAALAPACRPSLGQAPVRLQRADEASAPSGARARRRRRAAAAPRPPAGGRLRARVRDRDPAPAPALERRLHGRRLCGTSSP